MSDIGPRTTPPRQPPLADSPLFWLALFGAVALIALAIIWPKHAHRQARLARMAEARQQAQLRVRSDVPAEDSRPAGEEWHSFPADEDSLWPLAIGIVVLVGLLSGLLIASSRRGLRRAPDPATPASPRDPSGPILP